MDVSPVSASSAGRSAAGMSDAARAGFDRERPTLEDIAHSVRGVAQLLDLVARAEATPDSLRTGLELLSGTLGHAARKASGLIEDIGINLNEQLGVTTADLAQIRFAPMAPPFHRQPGTLEAWTEQARAEFTMWGAVETILAQDDVSLERRFGASPEEHLALVEALERLRARWQGEVKLLEATLLRLAVAVARWEQSGRDLPHS